MSLGNAIRDYIERCLGLLDVHAGFEPAHDGKATIAAAGPDFLYRIVRIFSGFRAQRYIRFHIHNRVRAAEFAWSHTYHREGAVV